MLRINKVQELGRAGKDAEVVGNGKIAKVSIAVQDNFKDKDGKWQDRSHWFTVVFIGETITTKAAKIKKGDNIFVEGKLVVNSWEDKDGNKRSQVEINAFAFDFYDKKSGDSEASTQLQKTPSQTTGDLDYDPNTLPF